jgi:acyl carrier protein
VSVGAANPPGPELCDEVMILLREVTGEAEEWLADIGPQTRLDGDLLIDSVEFAALSQILVARYGDQVDLLALIADLDIDQIIGLRVTDVADHVAARMTPRVARATAR